MEQRTLTLQTLLYKGACEEQTDLFKKLFPDGQVTVTVELAMALADKWSWDWAAETLLSDDGWREWLRETQPAEDTYQRQMRPFWDAEHAAYARANQAREKFGDAWVKEHPGQDAETVVYYQERKIWRPAEIATQEASLLYRPALVGTYARVFAEIYIREGKAQDGVA